MKNYFYTNCFAKNNKIFLRGYGAGKRFLDEITYQPYLFVPGDGEYRDIYGNSLIKQEFKNIRAARDFADSYGLAVNGKVFGFTNYIYAYLNDEFPDKIDYDASLISVVSLDIEVYSGNQGFPSPLKAEAPISAITLTRNGRTITFGSKVYRGKNPYVFCQDEKQLLMAFLDVWDSDAYWSPDVVTGWSVDLFDIPYLINRTERLLGPRYVEMFSPLRHVSERELVRAKSSSYSNDPRKRTDTVWEIAGITVLDYLQLYKKFTVKAQESYRLDYISKVELGERKHDYSDVGTLDDLYDKDFDRYIDYNVHDAVLVEKLEAKKKYLQIVFSIAYHSRVNFIDTMTTTRPWDAIIHTHLLKKGIAIPQTKEPENNPQFRGAWVKDTQIGLHEWVVSFDFDALYPRVISQHNISPETFVRKFTGQKFYSTKDDKISEFHIDRIARLTSYLKENNFTMTANGCLYRKDRRGFIPEVVDEILEARVTAKSRMLQLKRNDPQNPEIEHLDNYQKAIKILTNGLYGALGMKYFRWFDIDLAESTTVTSQLATRYLEQKANIYLNKVLKTDGVDYVVACDTDSMYLKLGALVTACVPKGKSTDDIIEFVDAVCKQKLQPYIERCCLELSELFNVYKFQLKMKQESIANKGIWRGKKMYILNVYDSEGVRYSEPEMVMKGIEAIRSSTPMLVRDRIKQSLKVIMNGNEADLQKFVKEFHAEFIKLPFEQIAFPRTANNLDEYSDAVNQCKKGTPIHVRGALVHNVLLDSLELGHKYPRIKDKDKVRFSYLIQPNPTHSHVIAASDELPPEFGLEEYLDYETQYEKAFKLPIQSITDVIGWKLVKIPKLPFKAKQGAA